LNSPPPNERVYIDTNVFLYLFKATYRPDLTRKASGFLRKVEAGQYDGVLSTVVLLELVKTIRQVTVEFDRITKPAVWEKDVQKAISWIYSLKNVKFIEGAEPLSSSLGYRLLAEDSLKTLLSFPGTHKYNDTFDPRHDGLSPIDAMHLELAKKSGCSCIATFDSDFTESDGYVPVLNLNRSS